MDEAVNYQETIDKWLRVVYSHHYRLMSRLYPQAIQHLTIEQLREGPLGQDLARLAALARGEIREAKERVLEAIDSVLQILFWPPGAEDYTVPRSFWETDLGRMISMAKFRAYEPSELISIGSAAQQLGVTRPTIYRWMDDRTLGYVRDEMSGRTFVVRADVENLRREMESLGSEH
ncbi:MAG: excisionase family DNA-binding protein [Sphaerobacter sp.]|nr:excisionase family DNA-binding protein [Sphaerobacter sp.]